MKIKIINKSNNDLPSYATIGSAGMDIRANLSSPVVIPPMKRLLIPTGIFIELPDGYEAQLRPRSGLAHKHGITLSNSPATIDSDYRGQCFVSLINMSDENFTINHGDRIAQMIISKYEKCEWLEVENINDTTRGDGGFGHTKIN